MPVISAPERVVGIAATRAPADRGDRLRGIDHPAAAEGDEPLGAAAVEQRRGGVGNLAGLDLEDLRRRLGEAGSAAAARARW